MVNIEQIASLRADYHFGIELTAIWDSLEEETKKVDASNASHPKRTLGPIELTRVRDTENASACGRGRRGSALG